MTTPGQAAYEAHRDALGGNRPWSDVRAPEREVWEATAQGATGELRKRITGLAGDLYESAAATAPSKKSEIERSVADRLRGLLDGQP